MKCNVEEGLPAPRVSLSDRHGIFQKSIIIIIIIIIIITSIYSTLRRIPTMGFIP